MFVFENWSLIIRRMYALECLEGCPDGWQLFNQHCYFISTDTVDWNKAQETCNSMYGSQLTSSLSEDENDFIFRELIWGQLNLGWFYFYVYFLIYFQ